MSVDRLCKRHLSKLVLPDIIYAEKFNKSLNLSCKFLLIKAFLSTKFSVNYSRFSEDY